MKYNNIIQGIEFITLNIASFGWILLDVASQMYYKHPLLTWLIGLSIVFFNVARGIAVLRKKGKDESD